MPRIFILIHSNIFLTNRIQTKLILPNDLALTEEIYFFTSLDSFSIAGKMGDGCYYMI